jgi:hypothetical protein
MVRLVFKNIFLILLNPNWIETWPELGLKKKKRGVTGQNLLAFKKKVNFNFFFK